VIIQMAWNSWPAQRIEILINMPPWFNRSNGEPDGWGDLSFNSKFRIIARNEEHGNAIIAAFLRRQRPCRRTRQRQLLRHRHGCEPALTRLASRRYAPGTASGVCRYSAKAR
jgi:hypothetical protein